MQFQSITRRAVVINLLRASAAATVSLPGLQAHAQYGPGFSGGQQRGFQGYIGAFQRQFRVPAISIAQSSGGRFVFDHAGGMVNREHVLQAQQNSLFRIADLSQSITAVAIFSLIEAGKLKLTDKVFGPAGVLGMKYGKPPYKLYVADITVDHLLTHTCGGWAADSNDPMLHNGGWDQTKLITSTIENVPLINPPGTQWAYSNFGFCLLGRVIEAVTSQSYESYVQSAILAPCGISGMQIAQNSERHRAPNEVIYIGEYSEDPYKINVNRMDSCAGWIASSTQLVQFLDHVGGAPGIPSLLKPETIRQMTTPVAVYPQGSARCARGWMVGDDGSWWHQGSLPGSTALMIRRSNSASSAALCNTRSEPHQEMDGALYQLLQQLRQRTA